MKDSKNFWTRWKSIQELLENIAKVYRMPYEGEFTIHKVRAYTDYENVVNKPNLATIEQMVTMTDDRQEGNFSAKGNLESNTESIDILKEVTQALDELKVPTTNVEKSNQGGYTGEIRHDSEYIYVCVSTNNWKRVRLETF